MKIAQHADCHVTVKKYEIIVWNHDQYIYSPAIMTTKILSLKFYSFPHNHTRVVANTYYYIIISAISGAGKSYHSHPIIVSKFS